MKKIISLLLSSVLLLTMCSMGVGVAAEEREIIVNVKDYGAVGDGKTNDRAAIMSAFNFAITNYASKSIPVTVYFPEGEYGLLRGGMYINLPAGSGNLTVKGAGADKSTIVYLEEWTNGGTWVALRFQMASEPTSEDDYLHDISIENLGVYDTDPVNHAWHVDKGDPGTEETHGFDINYCIRATVKNCKVDSVGDEAIDLGGCIDSEVSNNVVLNSPGAGSGGGAISVGDDSKNIRIANNVVIGSISDATKFNWAIAVEVLSGHVEGIQIENNIIQNMGGWGMRFGTPNGTTSDILVKNNQITGCRDGGIRTDGKGLTTDVKVLNNTFDSMPVGIELNGENKEYTIIENCTFNNISYRGIAIMSGYNTLIQDIVMSDCKATAVFNAGTDTKMNRMFIDGAGLKSGTSSAAIMQYGGGGSSEVTNTVILNCHNKKGMQDVQKVVNTWIDQEETSGYVSISGADVIQNCKVNRIIQAKGDCTIDGLILATESELGTYALNMSGKKNCTVTNCVFVVPSRYAIRESGSADNNIITNNVTIGGDGICIVGANTVSTGNATGTIVLAEQYRYRVVDGQVTILEWLDKTVASASIPAVIEEYPVVAVDAWAFALCDSLTTVTIPASVATIGANAFYMCDGLLSVKYQGARAAWGSVAIGDNNNSLLNASLRCYSDLYSEKVGHSVMDTTRGNGLAFRFELNAFGVGIVSGNRVDLTNATVNYMGSECKLIGMGAVVTNDAAIGTGDLTLEELNGKTVVDIPAVYLQEVEADSCAFAVRIINIPSTALDRTVYARPYYIIELDGEQLVVYDAVNSAACIDYM